MAGMDVTAAAELVTGSWRLERCDNFDEYLRELGINVVLRKLAAIVTPTVTFGKNPNGDGDKWHMETVTPVRTVRIDFSLDEPFEETTIDLRTVESVYSLELSEDGNEVVLINLQTDKRGRRTRIERRVYGKKDRNIMHVIMTCNDVVSTAVFNRLKH